MLPTNIIQITIKHITNQIRYRREYYHSMPNSPNNLHTCFLTSELQHTLELYKHRLLQFLSQICFFKWRLFKCVTTQS